LKYMTEASQQYQNELENIKQERDRLQRQLQRAIAESTHLGEQLRMKEREIEDISRNYRATAEECQRLESALHESNMRASELDDKLSHKTEELNRILEEMEKLDSESRAYITDLQS